MRNIERHNIRVAIGATSLVKPLTGIGFYTLNLAKVLSKRPNLKIEYLYANKCSKALEIINAPILSKIKKLIRQNIPYAYYVRRAILQYIFDLAVRKKKFDLYHEPNFIPKKFDGPTVITVHDLSYIRFPEAHPVERVEMMEKMLPPAIDVADCIIADSYYTKREIMLEFDVSDEKIHVTHLGKSEEFYPRLPSEVTGVTNKFSLVFGEYNVVVGTIEPRKNLIQAIRAYKLLPDEVAKSFPLAIIGARGWKEADVLTELNSLTEQGKAKVLGYVDSDDLPALYTGAKCLLFPSIYEGFGLPVLEAMACGTPVIACNSSSIPEVIEDAGILVDVGDDQGMRSCIERLCFDDVERSRLSELGLVQAEKFSWEKCAEETYSAYLYALQHARQ